MGETKTCPICGSEAYYELNFQENRVFWGCPVCGRFQLGYLDVQSRLNYNHLLSYLVYHRFEFNDTEYRYHTTLDKDICDKYKKEFESGNGTHGHPVHMDIDMIENWYPKTFSERVDYILMYINAHTPHIGQEITWNFPEMLGALFVDRYDIDKSYPLANSIKQSPRDEDDCTKEAEYILKYLASNSYIEYTNGPDTNEAVILTLAPDGYKRVDQLLKNTSHGRSALVAMKFGEDTRNLREAIRQGIASAGYVAVFIDEVQHNDLITPELLKHIKDSKFVVVDLTHQNNGAYFEEGYAMGLGKPVIQLCRQGTYLHFDIAQKNTIIWETEEDIPERLYNRITATID